MKSREEFKESIYRKRDLYLAKRKRRRQAVISISWAAACFVLIFAFVFKSRPNTNPTSRDEALVGHRETTKPTYGPFVKTIKVLDRDVNLIREYKSEQKVNTLVEYIDILKMETHPGIKEESSDEKDSNVLYITLTYSDNESITYLFVDNYLYLDDKWHNVDEEKLNGLIEFINSMESDY